MRFTQDEVDTLREDSKRNTEEMKEVLEDLSMRVAQLEKKLETAVEENIKLEQYTRRENLRFNNIAEQEGEDCKALIRGVIQNEMGIDASHIKFHAVHRVGKKIQNRCRPIIARFISREDRNEIWSNRGKIKHSKNYPDAYLTEDFAKAIQNERKVLIKAMMKARESQVHPNAKVVGRYLWNETFLCVLFIAFFCIYSACLKTQSSCFCYNNHNDFSLVSLHGFFLMFSSLLSLRILK